MTADSFSLLQMLQTGGGWLAWLLVGLLCVGGLLLSCTSLSGTWLVTLAAIIALVLTPGSFPGWGCIGAFLAISTGVELAEWGASSWGVARRGGSGGAGWAALVGGLAGMVAGTVVLPPIVGSLLGMAAGSFAGAFLVERRRLRHSGKAAQIAWGAVVARVMVVFLKVAATLAMIGALGFGTAMG